MYLLDTNVVSELRKVKVGRADAHVAAWAQNIPVARLFISVITLLELESGVLLLSRRDSAQGDLLRQWLSDHVMPAFAGRILPVNEAVTLRCAPLHVPDPQPERDALIAATALVHGMTVVTRNVADFEPLGVALLNLWKTHHE
jgi:toxin FitB